MEFLSPIYLVKCPCWGIRDLPFGELPDAHALDSGRPQEHIA